MTNRSLSRYRAAVGARADHGYRFSQRGDVYAISPSGTPALVAHGHACGPDVTQEKTSNHRPS
jgi:hypothetical protein